MVNVVPQLLNAQDGPWAQHRIGVIASATDQEVIVVVGGTSFPSLALSGDPLAEGDIVSVVRQQDTWVVLGRLTGQGPNQVLNFSFEESIPGSFPPNWTLYDVTGTSAAAVQVRDGAPGGDHVVSVTSSSGAAATSILYSDPISVVPGQTWNLAAFVGADYGTGASATADADLMALWFANATDLYPTTSATDSVVASLTDVAQLPPFSGISGSVTVPDGAAVMRVGLRSTVDTEQALEWDFVTARSRGVEPATEGPVRYVNIVANSATTVAEAIILNTGNITWRAGRAYNFLLKGFVQSSVSADRIRVRGRRTNLAGAMLLDTNTGLPPINGANNNVHFYLANILANHTGADVVQNMVMTIERIAGTGNVLVPASGTQPAFIQVTDIGPSTAFPGATQI